MTNSAEILKLTGKALREERTNRWDLRYTDAPGLIDVRASKASLARCLSVLEILLEEFDKAGYQFETSYERPQVVHRGRGGSRSHVVVGDHRVPFGIRERLRREQDERLPGWPTEVMRPTGCLLLFIGGDYGPHIHRDTSTNQEPEALVASVMAAMPGFVKRLKRANEEAKAFRAEWDARLERMREEEAREVEEARRRSELAEESEAWATVSAIRTYIQAVRRASGPSPWLAWAENYTNLLDPLPRRVAANADAAQFDAADSDKGDGPAC